MIADRLWKTVLTRALVVSTIGAAMFGFGARAQSPRVKVIEFIEISGLIDPPVVSFLERQLREAHRGSSEAVIIRLDTPGSVGVSVNELIATMSGTKVPIVVWVAPSNASARGAGFFLILAADVAAMSPGSSVGPAYPVSLTASGSEPDSGVEGFVHVIAFSRGRDPESALTALAATKSIDAKSAAQSDVVDLIAPLRTLLDDLDARPIHRLGPSERLETKAITLRSHKMSVWERTLHTAISPEVSYFLLLFGLFGLIFELYHPGIGAAGLLGGGSIALSVYALALLPVWWPGVALTCLAIALFAHDLHRGGFGLFTAFGIVGLIAGSATMFAGAPPVLTLSPWAIAAGTVATLIFFISVMSAAISARLARPAPGAEKLIGTLALARTDISPEGEVEAAGDLWRARTSGAAIPEGAPVMVRSVVGLTLIVESEEPDG